MNILETDEYFEEIAEEWFMLDSDDVEYFNLSLVTKWELDRDEYLLRFYFESEWDMDSFMDSVYDCPKIGEQIGLNEHCEAVDRQNLIVIIEGLERVLP